MGKSPEEIQAFDASRSQSDSEVGETPEWTAEEEKKVVRKLDLTVLPLLTMVFFALQLDRGNIGNALTDNFLKDVGITQYQYNIGQQLLSAGIVILEIPSNILLYRFGPQKWISGQILCWGLVATFQAFQHGLGAYLSTRLLLGLCEAGFIPAGLYTLSTYYKQDETSKRFSVYFFGNMTALASTGLLAYGILHMRGICNLGGWQWLFLLEGLFTILCGAIFFALFPESPSRPRSFLNVRFFTEREEYVLLQRVLREGGKEKQSHNITRKELVSTLSNWRIYPHVIISLCGIAPATTLGSYAPTLVKSFGYGKLKANALVSVGSWIQILLNYLSGLAADKTNRRGLVTLTGQLLWWGFSIGNLVLSSSANKHAKYALLTLALSVETIWHPVNGSWLAINSRSPAERSITMAMFVMAANAGGIIGSQLFQSSDSPDYTTGWTAIVCLLSVSVAANLFTQAQYVFYNRKHAKLDQAELDDKNEGAIMAEKRRYEL